MRLRISGRDWDFFKDFTIELKFDSIASSFSFSGVFDPNNKEHLDLYRPLTYKMCQVVSDRGEILITGVILNHDFTESAKPELVRISGYSITGVLEDSKIPISSYPLQFDGLSLKQITDKLIAPFGLNLIVSASALDESNAVIEKTTAGETETIKGYLTSLSSQKSLIFTHDNQGNLILTKARTDARPSAIYRNNDGSYLTAKFSINGQALHSEIALLRQASIFSENAGESIIRNPLVSSFRPDTRIQNSGDDNDTSKAAANALSSELKTGIVLTLTTNRIEWKVAAKGEIIKPNNIISVKSDRLYLRNFTNFFIESVSLQGKENSETATIKAVLPEVYSNTIPKNIF